MINGLGATPLMELYIINNKVSKILGKKDGEAIVQRGVEKAERIIEETEDDEIKTALNVLNAYIINHIKKLPAQEQKKGNR